MKEVDTCFVCIVVHTIIDQHINDLYNNLESVLL